ncbi:hypothetical protein Kpol_1013p37, partial [Vanderwaltozyma polyspora DSM 70294]
MSKKSVYLEDLEVDLNYRKGDDKSINERLRELEFQRNQRLKDIPTIDEEVRIALEVISELVDVDNEDNRSRRERLIHILSNDINKWNKYEEYLKSKKNGNEEVGEVDEEDAEEEFYTPANQSFIDVRQFLIQYSIEKSSQRLKKEQSLLKDFNMKSEILSRRAMYKSLTTVQLNGSQVISSRPISKICISPEGTCTAAGSWAGDISIFNTKTLAPVITSRETHSGKISGIDWSSDSRHLVSGGEDGIVKLYNFDSNSIQVATSFIGHDARVTNVKFHPSQKYIGSASFDTTWRLWDIVTNSELLLQEGHSKEIYSLSFQTDGSLIATAGADKVGIIWDLRSGKNILSLVGHAKPIYCSDWSQNGYQ